MTGAMPPGPRPNAGIGCLGSVLALVVVTAVVVLALLVGFIGLVIIGGLLVIGLLAWAIDRVLLAFSPKRRERRSQQGGVFVWRMSRFGPGVIIDTEAIETEAIDTEAVDHRAIDTTATETRRSDEPERGGSGSGGTESDRGSD